MVRLATYTSHCMPKYLYVLFSYTHHLSELIGISQGLYPTAVLVMVNQQKSLVEDVLSRHLITGQRQAITASNPADAPNASQTVSIQFRPMVSVILPSTSYRYLVDVIEYRLLQYYALCELYI